MQLVPICNVACSPQVPCTTVEPFKTHQIYRPKKWSKNAIKKKKQFESWVSSNTGGKNKTISCDALARLIILPYSAHWLQQIPEEDHGSRSVAIVQLVGPDLKGKIAKLGVKSVVFAITSLKFFAKMVADLGIC